MIAPGAWRRGEGSDHFESDFESENESDGEQRGLSESESESGSGRQRGRGAHFHSVLARSVPIYFVPTWILHIDENKARKNDGTAFAVFL
jgi:hypothetical protein